MTNTQSYQRLIEDVQDRFGSYEARIRHHEAQEAEYLTRLEDQSTQIKHLETQLIEIKDSFTRSLNAAHQDCQRLSDRLDNANRRVNTADENFRSHGESIGHATAEDLISSSDRLSLRQRIGGQSIIDQDVHRRERERRREENVSLDESSENQHSQRHNDTKVKEAPMNQLVVHREESAAIASVAAIQRVPSLVEFAIANGDPDAEDGKSIDVAIRVLYMKARKAEEEAFAKLGLSVPLLPNASTYGQDPSKAILIGKLADLRPTDRGSKKPPE